MKKVRLAVVLLLAAVMLSPSSAWIASAFSPEPATNRNALTTALRPNGTPCPAGSDRPYPPCWKWP